MSAFKQISHLTCYMLHVTCYMDKNVTCYMLHVSCHKLYVTCHIVLYVRNALHSRDVRLTVTVTVAAGKGNLPFPENLKILPVKIR